MKAGPAAVIEALPATGLLDVLAVAARATAALGPPFFSETSTLVAVEVSLEEASSTNAGPAAAVAVVADKDAALVAGLLFAVATTAGAASGTSAGEVDDS